jgi:hypothetical protein
MIKIPNREINSSDPWCDDCGDTRSNVAGNILKILKEEANNNFVIAVDGKWGTGKTFFLKRLQTFLYNYDLGKGKPFKAIYFSAWEEDFMQNPLVAIIGQMYVYIKEQDETGELLKKLKELVPPLLKTLFFRGLAAATANVIDFNEKDFMSKNEKILENYSESLKETEQLKTLLSSLANMVYEKTEKPLVFIIDELDRCRPLFAIELLERIKHIFNIPHIIFILGIDKEQLSHTIQSVYGNINTDTYLHKFFDMEIVLPKIDNASFVLKIFNDNNITKGDNFRFHWDYRYQELINLLNLSLRECERYAMMLAFYLSKSRFQYIDFAIWLIYLKIKNRELYKKYIHKEATTKEVIDWIEESISPNSKTLIIDCEVAFYLFDENSDAISKALSLNHSAFTEEFLSTRLLKIIKDNIDQQDERSKIVKLFEQSSQANHYSGYAIFKYIKDILELSSYK